jgi:hypothetical protein
MAEVRKSPVSGLLQREVVGAGVEGVDDGDVPHRKGGFAIGEVVGPFAHEAVVEAEGADLLGAVAEVVVPEAEGASVVVAKVVDVVEDEAAGAGERRSEPGKMCFWMKSTPRRNSS